MGRKNLPKIGKSLGKSWRIKFSAIPPVSPVGSLVTGLSDDGAGAAETGVIFPPGAEAFLKIDLISSFNV